MLSSFSVIYGITGLKLLKLFWTDQGGHENICFVMIYAKNVQLTERNDTSDRSQMLVIQ